MKLKGKIKDINIDFNTNNLIVSIETAEKEKGKLIDELKEKELSIELKQYREKRSLDDIINNCMKNPTKYDIDNSLDWLKGILK